MVRLNKFERQTAHRQTDTQTLLYDDLPNKSGRQTADRQTDKQTDRHTLLFDNPTERFVFQGAGGDRQTDWQTEVFDNPT